MEGVIPAILVPPKGHNFRDEDLSEFGVVSRKIKGFINITEVIKRDIDDLKRVYPDIPNAQLRALVDLNRKMYPQIQEVTI